MANEMTPSPHKGQLLIYRNGDLRVQVRIDGETVWLPQRLIAELFQVTVATVNEHLSNIYAEGELDPEATIRKFRTVQREGKGEGLAETETWIRGQDEGEKAMIPTPRKVAILDQVIWANLEDIGYGR